MATIPSQLVEFVRLICVSEFGVDPADRGIDLATVDLDNAPQAFKKRVVGRVKTALAARKEWQSMSGGEKLACLPLLEDGTRRPSERARRMRYVEGATFPEGNYMGNFSRYTFYNCDLSLATFSGVNLTAAVFYQCVLVDPMDSEKRMRIRSVGDLRANVHNCVGIDDILEDLAAVAAEERAYLPIPERTDNLVGWKMNPRRVAGLGAEIGPRPGRRYRSLRRAVREGMLAVAEAEALAAELGETLPPEPDPESEDPEVVVGIAVGTKRAKTIERVAGVIKRTLADLTVEEED